MITNPMPGDKVIWTSGAEGETGTVRDSIFVPGGDSGSRILLVIETARGRVCEYPGNLERLKS